MSPANRNRRKPTRALYATPDWLISVMAYVLVFIVCAVLYVADDEPRIMGLAFRDVWSPALALLAILLGYRAAERYATNRGTIRQWLGSLYGALALACVVLAVIRAM